MELLKRWTRLPLTLQGGEDPKFLARRIVRMASEDVGLANPNALQVTLNAWES